MTELDQICYQIYVKDGQYAVYDYVTANHPNIKWYYCIDCEDNTPTEPTGSSCLICGSGIDLS